MTQVEEIINLLVLASEYDCFLLASYSGSIYAVERWASEHCQRYNFCEHYTQEDINTACAEYAKREWESWVKA